MSERDTELGNSRQRSPGKDNKRAESAKSFLASVLCVLGLIVALGAMISTIISGGAFGVVSAGAIGALLGIISFFLGANRLGIATIVFSIASLFFGLAVSQSLIPGLDGQDRILPAEEPGAQRPGSG